MILEIKYCNDCPAMKLYKHWKDDGSCDAICDASRNDKNKLLSQLSSDFVINKTKIEIPSWCWYLKKAMKEENNEQAK